ncbi:MAG: sugar phosphate nucleotidyltransferase [Gemmataceae bacterium]
MQDVLGFILGGGRGSGLYPLTKFRSVPAVSIGGKYRLIDVPISNCINSGMLRIYVLTQVLSASLHRHVTNSYSFAPFSRGSVEMLAAQQTNETAEWYKGTADALRQNLRYIGDEPAGDVLIVSADGLYRMDFREMLREHRDRGAALTIAAVCVPRERAGNYGILEIDDTGRVKRLIEKPRDPELQGLCRADGSYLANMGIYLCRRDFLVNLLRSQPNDMDLVTQMFAPAVRTYLVHAYQFHGYWQDLGHSIRTYHESQLALASDQPPFDFHTPDGVIYTHMRNLPASRVQAAQVEQSLISEGCVIEPNVELYHSLVGLRARVGAGTVLRETVVCGADRYDTPETPGPPLGIGPNCLIERAILDKDCRIGANVRILARGRPERLDAENYVVREGILVVPKGAILPDNTFIGGD